MSDAAAAVARGIALLDEKRPGWEDEIDIAQLNIMSATKCICGQLYGGYQAGIDAFGGISGLTYGFASGGDVAINNLNEAWREAIALRRLQRAPVLTH